jgi:putative ABC transport system permease protein
MIKNYLKTAFRNLRRNFSYAFINVIGLAVGIAACLLIFLVVRFEKSFDNFHAKRNEIYRINSAFYTQDGYNFAPGISFPVAPALKEDFPQLKNVSRIYKKGESQITTFSDFNPQKKFITDIYFTDPSFFDMFDFPWLAGDPKTALAAPSTAALTQEAAEKFFGDWHRALGQTIKYNNDDEQVYKITGILKNVPANTDFPLSVVVSFNTMEKGSTQRQLSDWVSTFGGSYCFIQLPGSFPVEKFNRELVTFAKRHKPETSSKDYYLAQPLSDIHYNKDFGNFRNHTFSKSLITALELIGLFLILVACVNFVNLATAQAINRSKEVGVRKVLGGNRNQLAFQFLSETAVITVFSMIVALLIAFAALPFLNVLLSVKMEMSFVKDPSLLIFIVSVIAGVTMLSGLYPAFVLSSFNPVTALKSRIAAKSTGGISLRRVLVVLQFSIAHILIIGTLIVVSQMNYFNNASLGFDKAAIVNVNIPNDSISNTKIDFLRNELKSNPDIQNVSFSFASPASNGNWNTDFRFDHQISNTNFSASLKWADVDYFKTYNMQFVAGEPYRESDTVNGFVVNEALLEKLSIHDPKQAIGKEINMWDGQMVAPIVGVVKNFNSNSLRDPVEPVLLANKKEDYSTINIKIVKGKETAVLPYVEKLWNQAFPDYVYKFQFLDEKIANFYAQENQLAKLYKIFAGIAILISCLGLYGLVSFMAVQRTKEVGIRKVLGASVSNIVYLLSKEFSLLIIIAFVIAAPVAWYIMHQWLQNYTYRIQLGAPIFILAILSSIVIAWITVGHRAVKAAIANPVKSLRTE